MSARIVVKESSKTVNVVYFDTLGYAVCKNCASDKAERVELNRPDPDYARCDKCGNEIATEVVHGMAIVEHPGVKIF